MRARPRMSGTFSTLARRWKMALKEMAPILLRPRRACLVAAAALSLLAVAGCNGHRRESLRPIYTSPSTVSAPAPIAARVPVRFPSSRVVRPRGYGFVVPHPVVRAGHRRAGRCHRINGPVARLSGGIAPLSQRNALPEPAPKASIGSEPDLDMIPSQSVKPRSSASSFILRPLEQGDRRFRGRPGNLALSDHCRRRPHGFGHGPGPPGQLTGAASPVPWRVGKQRALLSQQGRPPLAVHRPAPQCQRLRQLRPDRRRAPQGSGI